MSDYDIFNGDADGLCALQQLRLHEPRAATLVTGVKRDIALLQQVCAAPGDRLTVLDISLDKNRDALSRALDQGAQVRYFDHHYAGTVPEHPSLETHIDPAPETCTSLLVDRVLEGRYRAWAVVGAFGDNLHASARAAAAGLGLDDGQLMLLEELGTYLNYNGYGSALEDLLFHPAELYRAISPYSDPLAFVAEAPAFLHLRDGYGDDMTHARALEAEQLGPGFAVYRLPDAPWSRRVSGVFGNELARAHPQRAHAILTVVADGFRVSVRAPLARREGADSLCREFPSGGGRAAAAGINLLPAVQLERFIARLAVYYP